MREGLGENHEEQNQFAHSLGLLNKLHIPFAIIDRFKAQVYNWWFILSLNFAVGLTL